MSLLFISDPGIRVTSFEHTSVNLDSFQWNEQNGPDPSIQVLGWREGQGELRRILENQHQLANDPSATITLYQDEEDKSILASYLFKKPSRNTFRKWNRRWFILRNSQLVYMKRSGRTFCIDIDLYILHKLLYPFEKGEEEKGIQGNKCGSLGADLDQLM